MSENMIFCLGEGKYTSEGSGYQKSYQVFNKQLSKSEWENVKSSIGEIEITLTRWIEESKMSSQEKKDKPIYKEIGGYLKELSFEEAWKVWWSEASQKDKNKILNCGYFDAAIFKEITGIDVRDPQSLVGQEVEVKVAGKTYKAKIVSD